MRLKKIESHQVRNSPEAAVSFEDIYTLAREELKQAFRRRHKNRNGRKIVAFIATLIILLGCLVIWNRYETLGISGTLGASRTSKSEILFAGSLSLIKSLCWIAIGVGFLRISLIAFRWFRNPEDAQSAITQTSGSWLTRVLNPTPIKVLYVLIALMTLIVLGQLGFIKTLPFIHKPWIWVPLIICFLTLLTWVSISTLIISATAKSGWVKTIGCVLLVNAALAVLLTNGHGLTILAGNIPAFAGMITISFYRLRSGSPKGHTVSRKDNIRKAIIPWMAVTVTTFVIASTFQLTTLQDIQIVTVHQYIPCQKNRHLRCEHTLRGIPIGPARTSLVIAKINNNTINTHLITLPINTITSITYTNQLANIRLSRTRLLTHIK